MATLTCPDCGSEMVLRNSRFGKFYGCSTYPACKAAHGAHPNGKPLGIPADKETKQWRIKAHDAFDTLWKRGGGVRIGRSAAYKWLQESLSMTSEQCHIGRFDIETCKRVIAAVESKLTNP